MPHHDDGGSVEWFLKVLVGEDANAMMCDSAVKDGKDVSRVCVEINPTETIRIKADGRRMPHRSNLLQENQISYLCQAVQQIVRVVQRPLFAALAVLAVAVVLLPLEGVLLLPLRAAVEEPIV